MCDIYTQIVGEMSITIRQSNSVANVTIACDRNRIVAFVPRIVCIAEEYTGMPRMWGVLFLSCGGAGAVL